MCPLNTFPQTQGLVWVNESTLTTGMNRPPVLMLVGNLQETEGF